jgi:enamine deaminase RidA (YjgF/YER057c/UK114 family)
MSNSSGVGAPLANYAAWRRAGDFVFTSGVIAVDPGSRRVVDTYDALGAQARSELRTLGLDTGQMSVDVFEAPIAAPSWFVLNRVRDMARECGGDMRDVVRLVQYFRDLRHYPVYNRVRGLFFGESVVSTVVEVSRMLPGDQVLVEVEATLFIPHGPVL